MSDVSSAPIRLSDLRRLSVPLGNLEPGWYLIRERTDFQARVCRAGEDEDGMICATELAAWVPLADLWRFRR